MNGAVAQPSAAPQTCRPSRGVGAELRLPRVVVRTGLAVLAVLLTGCASAAREPWVLPSQSLDAPPTRFLEQIVTYPQALASVLDIMQRDLGLPALEVKLVFVPDADSFERLLLQIGYTPALARDAAQIMTAIGGHRAVLINQQRLEQQEWPRRVSLLAHELGHVLQYELGGGVRGRSAQWLREGFAEWMALRVMEALRRVDGHEVRREARRRVRTHRSGDFPTLAQLDGFPDWVAQSRGPAGEALYDFALVAVSALLERGPEPVLRYFRLFAARQEPAANFAAAFGESEADFEKRLRDQVWRR